MVSKSFSRSFVLVSKMFLFIFTVPNLTTIVSCPAGSFCIKGSCAFTTLDPTCAICERCSAENEIACVTSTNYVFCKDAVLQTEVFQCDMNSVCNPSGTREEPCWTPLNTGERLLCYRREYVPRTTTTGPSTTDTVELPISTIETSSTDSAQLPTSTLPTTTTDTAELPISTFPTSTPDPGEVPTSVSTSSETISSTQSTAPPIRTIQEYINEQCRRKRYFQNVVFPLDMTCSVYVSCEGQGENVFGELKGCPVRQLFDPNVGTCVSSNLFTCNVK